MREFGALLSVLGLLFVWSIPDVIALRHLLMLLAAVLLASQSPWQALAEAARTNRVAAVLLALFTAWLAMQAVFVSNETRWALGEIRGQWLIACLALLIGAALAARRGAARMPDASTITTMLMAVLAGQAAISVAQSVAWWFETGALLRQTVHLTGGKLEMSYLANILLAGLTVDLLYRAAGSGGFLRAPVVGVIATLLVALASTFLAGARNGLLGTVFLSLSALTLFVVDRFRRRGFRAAVIASMLLVCMIGAFAFGSFQADRRWESFGESARLAWDIDNNRAWVDSASVAFPKLSDGREVDTSAYLRIAFIHASLRLISDNPLGVGYGRNAFAHALRQTETTNVGHAHSGLMDLGIGGGIPALILWVALIASLVVVGWRRYFRDNDPHGLLLLLLATGYLGRMTLDSVNRDHMLQIFMFLVGYLLTVSSVTRQHQAAASPSALPSQ